MKALETSQMVELNLLAEISRVLTENLEALDITKGLKDVFSDFIHLEKLDIYVYDESTKTLRDFSKSWMVIEEFHKNTDTDNLYLTLARFNQYDFFVNDKPYKMKNLSKPEDIKFDCAVKIILFPLMKGDKPYGIVKLSFSNDISKKITPAFFKTLYVASYQISLKIQNTILADQMQININFHDAMKNIAKIIETQYELNYIIPLIGEMIDRFISEHLIYIFLRNPETAKFDLVWPSACRDKRILSSVSKLTSKSKHMLTDEGRIGIFPLIGEKHVLGCIVAHSNIDKLSKKEIDYLDQLTKQSSITIHRANVYAEVLQHATLDALTGLNNRRQFEVRLNQEVATARRQSKPLCAMMLDVDFFKSVNDTYGHVAGDLVLKNIANVIKAELREYDIASRYGGEEFSILLPYTRIEEAFAVAQRLRHSVETTPVDITTDKGESLSVKATVSIGVYQYSQADSPQDLYQKADNALYQAKTHGRNKVFIYKGDCQ